MITCEEFGEFSFFNPGGQVTKNMFLNEFVDSERKELSIFDRYKIFCDYKKEESSRRQQEEKRLQRKTADAIF